MPKAAQKEYDDQIEVDSGWIASVASERDVKIVHKKLSEGYMPSSPKFPYGSGNIGIIEVFCKVETGHSSYTYGHVTIA